MFFPKLRRRAKWVFLFLALAFGIGFVAFGVGTGVPGASLGDVLQDFVGAESAGESVDDARARVDESPSDPAARLALADALESAGRVDEAVAALEAYTRLRPRDADAKRRLAALYGNQVARASEEAELAELRAQEARVGQDFLSQSPFLQAVNENKIASTLAAQAQARADEAITRLRLAAQRQAAVLQELTLLEPDDPSLFLQLGVAAQQANDVPAAIAAFERFVELAPEDPNVPQVEQQLEFLRQLSPGPSG